MSDIKFNFVAAGADAVKNAFRSIADAAKKTSTDVKSSAEKQLDAQVKAAQKTVAAAKSAETQRLAIEKKFGADVAREWQRQADARVRAEQRANEKIASSRREAFGKILGGAGRVLGIGAGMSATALAASALGGVGAAAREAMALQGMSRRISILGHSPGEAFFDPKKITSAVEQTAIANPGTKSEDLATGLQTLVSMTHDLPGSIAQLDTMATAMQAMGTDAEGTARTMIALRNSFGIKEPKEMQQALGSLSAQMKSAGVPFDAMESHVLALAATASRFGFHGAGGVAQMGGMIALATSGVGDPAKAEKAASKFMDKITEHSGQLAAFGIKTQDSKGSMLPMQQIVSNIISGFGGHNMGAMKSELVKMFGGGERGGAAVLGKAVSTYEATFNATKGGDQQKQAAATVALNAELERLMGSTASYANLVQEAGQVQKSASAQLQAAWTEIVAKVGEDVVPALVKMVPAVRKIAESGIVDEFISVVGAAVEGLSEMVDFLKQIGLINPKQKTKTEQLQDAQKKLDRFEAGISNPMSMTPAQIQERKRLRGAVSDAQEALFPSAEPGASSNVNKVFKSFSSPEDFAKQFAQLSGAPVESSDYQRELSAGKIIAQRLNADPNADVRGLGGGEKASQMEHDYASQLIQQKAAAEADKKKADAAKDSAKALMELASAARTAREDLSRSQPISARP